MLHRIFWSFALCQYTLVADIICSWQREGLHGSPHAVIEVTRPSDSLNEASMLSTTFSLSTHLLFPHPDTVLLLLSLNIFLGHSKVSFNYIICYYKTLAKTELKLHFRTIVIKMCCHLFK